MNEIRPVHLRSRAVESYPHKSPSRLRFIAVLLIGCAIGISLMAGYQYWRHRTKVQESPQSEDGWNRTAIEAKFYKSLEGRNKEAILFYSFRNNTTHDYTLDEDCSPTLFLVGQNRQLIAVPAPLSTNIQLSLPLFIPARHEATYGVIKLEDLPADSLLKEDPNSHGLEIFDHKHKFEILLPNNNVK